MGPATASAGVILGCRGSPSILGVVVPLTLSEPLAIGVAVIAAAELDAAVLKAFAGVPEVLLVPSSVELGVDSLDDDVVEWVVEAAAASLVEAAASRGNTAYRWAVVVGHFVASNTAETAKDNHCARMVAAFR